MKRFLIVGGLIGAFVMGAVAYAIAQDRLFSQPAAATGSSERIMEIAIEQVINGETIAGTVQVNFEEADGLPQVPPDAHGLFLSQSGDQLILGTGSIEVEVNVEVVNDQEPVEAVSAVHSGDEVTIAVNENTVVYLDTTPHPEPTREDIENGSMTMKHTVQPGSLSDLGNNTMVRAWGTMDGDMLVAEILVAEPIH